ncbi:MAG: hypothetical protein K5893_03625 [Prevotella sp.]|nr:hypothetical protein [Prevotella sp.]
MQEKDSFYKQFWENLSPMGKVVMAVMTPIFAVVAGTERLIAKLTGSTYNEVNIVVYYLLMPLSWTVMIDYITKLPLLTPMFIIARVVFLWKDPMKFRDRCDWAFMKSVDFLLLFKRIGWNYIVSSVIICVVVPILIYIELIYAIIRL